MKSYFTLSFLLLSFISFAQKCDTIKGRVYNCIDIQGQKQGLWVEGFYGWRHQKNYDSVAGFCQTAPLVMTPFGDSSEGNYVNNKKVGIWKYYSDAGVEREVSYNDNGTIAEKNHVYNSVIKINSDSTIVSGYTVQNGDTLIIGYSNQKGAFKLDSNKVIVAFDCPNFNKFDYELLRLKMGMYDRDIRNSKFE